ncbi:MAG: hypothetical protein KDC14_08175 [Planctomycetes bacterium]|nr:hypothetical protein [Planctomycetota bacterium]
MQLGLRLLLGLLGALPAALAGAAAAPGSPVPAQLGAPESAVAESAAEEGAAVWEDLLLPRGFFLDLASGRVADRPFGAEDLRYERGELIAGEGAVGVFPGSGERIARGELVHGSRWTAERELVLGFELGVRGWGFLRVLEVTPSFVRLERWAKAGGEPGVANWRAGRLPVSDPSGPGLALDALADASGGPWRVESRRLGGERRWQALGEWSGTDTFVDSTPGSDAIREYRLVPLRSEGLYGLRARGVAARETDGASPPLGREDRVNLLTSSVSAGRFDLTVLGISSGGVNIMPEPGVRVASLGSNELDGWTLPDDDATRYVTQQRYLGVGRDVGVILPEGVFAHLRAERGDESAVRLVVQLNLWGDRLFMPAHGSVDWTWSEADGVRFDAAKPPPDAVASEIAGRLLERETEFDSNAWTAVGLAEAGEPQYDAQPGPAGVVRYRCTWVTRAGEHGPYGAPFGVLVGDDGGPSSERLIDGLIASLGHQDYDERRRARAGLRALGERALPRVRAALSSPDAEVAAAARELFALFTAPADEAASSLGKGFEKLDPALEKGRDDASQPTVATSPELLASLADSRGLGPAPEGWLAARAGERAQALLDSLDRVSDETEAWRALLAEADPDPAVRLVASLYPELVRWPARAPVFRAGEDGGAGDLTAEALAGVDVAADPWTALARLQLVHELYLARPATADAQLANEHALLALQLLERYANGGELVFLDAALQMVADPRVRLRAARNLFELRAEERARTEGRTELVLETADGLLLRDVLESLGDAEDTRIDLILPEGDYSDGNSSPVRVYGNGLRVVGQGHVRLGFGLMILGAGDVTFENLEIDPDGAACLRLQDANATLIGCRLISAGQGVQVNAGLLELIDCEVVDDEARGGKGGNGLRLIGRSACHLLRTRVEAGGDALIGARLALVERSVLDGGPRNAVSAMVEGELFAVDSLIRGGGNALHTVGRGLLEGCVLLGDSAVAMQLGDQFYACPAHLLSVGPEGQQNDWRRLPSCPSGR